jgi:hypothetical protein
VTRDVVFGFYRHRSRWVALRAACLGLLSDDGGLQVRSHDLIDHTLDRWERAFTQPDAAARAELERLLPQAIAAVKPETADALRFSVKPYLDLR